MSEQVPVTFKIKSILFPKIDFLHITNPMGDEFDYSFRIEALVVNDNTLRLLFGVRLVSKDKINENTPKVQATVEAIGEFEFNQNLSQIENVSQIPLGGNILAMMYPFIREKIYYFFSNN